MFLSYNESSLLGSMDSLRQHIIRRSSSSSDEVDKIKWRFITSNGDKPLKSKKSMDIIKSLDIINKHLSSGEKERDKVNVSPVSTKFPLSGKRKVQALRSPEKPTITEKRRKLRFSYLCETLDNFSINSPLRTSIESRFTVSDLDKSTITTDSTTGPDEKIKQSDTFIRSVFSPVKDKSSGVYRDWEEEDKKDSHKRETNLRETLYHPEQKKTTNRNKNTNCVLRGARYSDGRDSGEISNITYQDSSNLEDKIYERNHSSTKKSFNSVLRGFRYSDGCDSGKLSNITYQDSPNLEGKIYERRHSSTKKSSNSVLRSARRSDECDIVKPTNTTYPDSSDYEDNVGERRHSSTKKSSSSVLRSARRSDECDIVKPTNTTYPDFSDYEDNVGERRHSSTKKSSNSVLRSARRSDECGIVKPTNTYHDSCDLEGKVNEGSTRLSSYCVRKDARRSDGLDNGELFNITSKDSGDLRNNADEMRQPNRKSSFYSRYSDPRDSIGSNTTDHGFSYDLKEVEGKRRVFKRIKNTRCYSSLIDIDDVQKCIDDRIIGKHDKWMSSRPRKLVLLGDSHTRFLALGLQQIFPALTVQGFCKPSAKCEQVISGMEHTISTLTDKDFLILLCGTNDMWGYSIDDACQFISRSLKQIQNTNILVCNVPRNYSESDESHVQDNIHAFNKFLAMTVKDLEHATLVKLHKLKNKMYFTKHGLHFNTTGKIKICELIAHKLVDVLDLINV